MINNKGEFSPGIFFGAKSGGEIIIFVSWTKFKGLRLSYVLLKYDNLNKYQLYYSFIIV